MKQVFAGVLGSALVCSFIAFALSAYASVWTGDERFEKTLILSLLFVIFFSCTLAAGYMLNNKKSVTNE
jgi:uncharacterized membrane protein YphA (DoxX/SURF4 family)